MPASKDATSAVILHTAIELMSRRGYHRVSIREIARASHVSEMTVFRHFGSKLDILRAAMREKTHIPTFRELFRSRITWNLTCDLTLIASEYQQVMEKNRPTLKVFFSALESVEQELEGFLQDPLKLYENLCDYFSSMRQRGALHCEDIPALASCFLSMNVGYFMSGLFGDKALYPVKVDDFVRASVCALVQGISTQSKNETMESPIADAPMLLR